MTIKDINVGERYGIRSRWSKKSLTTVMVSRIIDNTHVELTRKDGKTFIQNVGLLKKLPPKKPRKEYIGESKENRDKYLTDCYENNVIAYTSKGRRSMIHSIGMLHKNKPIYKASFINEKLEQEESKYRIKTFRTVYQDRKVNAWRIELVNDDKENING